MNFYERYEKLCIACGIKPISEQAAKKIGVTRATISCWKKKGTMPKSETITSIAEQYNVSPDYLLGNTDDFTVACENTQDLNSEITSNVDDTQNDIKKADDQPVMDTATKKEKDDINYFFMSVYQRLDEVDRAKVEAYAQGLLEQEKYDKRSLTLRNA